MDSQDFLIGVLENIPFIKPNTLCSVIEDNKVFLFMTRQLCDIIRSSGIYNISNTFCKCNVNCITIILDLRTLMIYFVMEDITYFYKMENDFDITLESYKFGKNIQFLCLV